MTAPKDEQIGTELRSRCSATTFTASSRFRHPRSAPAFSSARSLCSRGAVARARRLARLAPPTPPAPLELSAGQTPSTPLVSQHRNETLGRRPSKICMGELGEDSAPSLPIELQNQALVGQTPFPDRRSFPRRSSSLGSPSAGLQAFCTLISSLCSPSLQQNRLGPPVPKSQSLERGGHPSSSRLTAFPAAVGRY